MNMHCHGFWHNVYVTYNYKAAHRYLYLLLFLKVAVYVAAYELFVVQWLHFFAGSYLLITNPWYINSTVAYVKFDYYIFS